MIERLLVALRYFADGHAERGEDAARRRAAGDFLDACRLIVDCPQYELGATARAALADLEALMERLEVAPDAGASGRAAAEARTAARRALVALGRYAD